MHKKMSVLVVTVMMFIYQDLRQSHDTGSIKNVIRCKHDPMIAEGGNFMEQCKITRVPPRHK